ncbi:MAG: tryptophan--tRNA ligase [Bacilli bacterium]|nr:tryptophan--tRNA ligase [Bacilli bacterium]MDD4547395.1 tryptophan--tRNA ligase [Bacilli bacterium]
MNKKNILTGDRPTGRLHLGHYFGSLKQRAMLQDEYNTYIIIADVQALTDNFENPDKVRKNVREVVLDNIAAGIDPKKTTIFIQSMIPQIAELTVFYSNLVTVSRLYRNPTIKTEIGQKQHLFGSGGESVTYGFLGYPVSQAADITAFDGALVPVGEDQIPLIEQTKEIVRKFNKIYGDTLVEPDYMVGANSRIKGLDGNEKMGKSLGNAIYLNDDEETISKKIMSARTDTNKIKKDDKGNPDNCMVYYYHKLVSNDSLETINKECRNGSRGCVSCKKELIKNMIEFLKPMQERRKYYEDRPELIDEILRTGTAKALEKAEEVMKRVRKNMKIDYFS